VDGVRQKLVRMRAGAKLRVLDLFAGCGGLSLGFEAAGCEIVAAVELDPDAARSHGINFHSGDHRHVISRDITSTTPTQLSKELGLAQAAAAFDVLVGGPPCQAFARVGRSKLREVADHPEAFRHDPRARLYIEYLRYVDACQPLAVVMENVPDILNHGGHNLADEIADVLESKGYTCKYTLLNAAFYGVPQMRERMFLVAIHREVGASVAFPKPTNWIDLPVGYGGSRSVALKLVASNADSQHPFFVPPPPASPGLPAAVTSCEALSDLPPLYAREMVKMGALTRRAQRFDSPIPYFPASELSEYARLMREWPGFEGTSALRDHVIRYLPRDYELFARLAPGDQYPEAVQKAEAMFEAALADMAKGTGARPRRGSEAWRRLRNSIVPPYDPGKFPNKWRKMEPDRPSRTLLAHLGKDSYSHIHYDHEQARTISVREAARLQSFPDGFLFAGTMNPAFKQIGNAVPPLMARAVATALLHQLRSRQSTGEQMSKSYL